MAKLEIGGKTVEVDDVFLDMTPEEQDAVVEDIHSDLEANGDIEPARQPMDMGSSLPGPLGQFQNTSQAFQSGAQQGMTLGFGDELEAGLFAVPEAIGGMFQGKGFDLGQGYNQALDRARGANEGAEQLNPIANIAGNITGNMALAGSLPTFSAKAAPTIGSMAGRGALDGLVYGGLTGFGTGEGMQDRLTGAATGGVLGSALGGAMGGVAGALANKATAAATPTSEQIGSAATDAYTAARQTQAVFKDTTTKELVDGIALAAQDARISDVTPQAKALLDDIMAKGGHNMTAGEVEDIRVLLNQLRAPGGDQNEARVAGKMIKAFDDLMDGLKPSDFAGGNAVAAVENLKEGRRLFQTSKKTEVIEDVIQRAADMSSANYSAAGYEQALRAQFKNLLTSKTALAGFSDEEIAAIRQVARGGPIENILRYVGKLAPTGVISGGIGAGIGYQTAGIPGAIAVPVAGSLARSGATASTLNNANLARALIAGGGKVAPPTGNMSTIAQALLRATGGAGGFAGGPGNDLIGRALVGGQ